MGKAGSVASWLVLLLSVCTGWVPTAGQTIRLPGGITIGDPRDSRNNVPFGRPRRPDPNSVCPKTMDWVGVLQREYPNFDLTHTMAAKVQPMAVPLFADETFQKAFGVSYLKLSDAERREFYQSHIWPCTSTRQFGSQAGVLTALNAPFLSGTVAAGTLSPGQLVPALNRLSTARSELQADEQSLSGMAPSADTYDRAAALAEQRKADLALVWPSEKARFEGVVQGVAARSAGSAVQAKIQPLLSAPPTAETVVALRETPEKFHALFAAMPAEQSTQLQAKLVERRDAILRQLLPAQQARAAAFAATREGLKDGADWFGEFSGFFLKPPSTPGAEAVAKAYLARREAALVRMEPQFRQKIETTQDPATVATLFDDVFKLREDRDSPTWQQVSTLRASRAKLLTERAEQAQKAEQQREERAAIARGDIVLSSLKVRGTENADVFRALYAGLPADAGLSRSNFLFAKMFEAYLIHYGQVCQEALPRTRVEMTYQKCTGDVPYGYYNGWGFVQTGSTCAGWQTMRYEPPAYADARSYAAERGAENLAMLSFAQEGMKDVLRNPLSPLGKATQALLSKASIDADVPALIEQNGCGSKALARLQENMTRLATDQDQLHLAGYQPDRVHTTQAADLDVNRLAGDLVRADAAGWLLNRYEGLNGAEVVGSPDAEGRPRRIQASYSQQGFTREGSLTITFSDGVPACLYFADAPATCKTPDAVVLERYRSGAYRR